jgi:putative transposase
VVTASQKREAVQIMQETNSSNVVVLESHCLHLRQQLSLRRACALCGISRASYRFGLKRDSKQDQRRWRNTTDANHPVQTRDDLVKKIKSYAQTFHAWGYRFVYGALINQDHLKINRKTVHRIWTAQNLSQRLKAKHRKIRTGKAVPVKALYPGHVWAYDFVFDQDQPGRQLKILNIVDEFTREQIALQVNTRCTSHAIVQLFAKLFKTHTPPTVLRSDNGPEFIAHALKIWLEINGTRTYHIPPGEPWNNGFIESLNSRLRYEFLNRETFDSPAHAQILASQFQSYYNTQRPHSSLGYKTPHQFKTEYLNSNPDMINLANPKVPVVLG